MRKFTFLSLLLMTLAFVQTAQAKDITIYVQADNQPNIHYWGGVTSSNWPGETLTETTVVKDLENNEYTFYYKTFTIADDGSVSFLFNYNGDADKTADISGVTDNSYYIYKGNKEYEDITAKFRAVSDATITKVQLPGSYNGWSGDANTMTAVTEGTVYTGTIDVTGLEGEALTFKLLVNNSNWLGYSNLTIDAPDGWLQQAASDNNIQLNYGAIGAKVYTVTATWAGGTSAATNWTLKIEAEANALIESVKLPGSYVGWDGDKAVFTAGEGAYTYALDLSETTDESVTLKLLVNGKHWLGYTNVTIDAPEGWAAEAASDNNIQLNIATAGTKKFDVTATWAGGLNASAGWTLKIAATNQGGATAINSLSGEKSKQYFNLQGQQVEKSACAKGIYIVNGKKVFVR